MMLFKKKIMLLLFLNLNFLSLTLNQISFTYNKVLSLYFSLLNKNLNFAPLFEFKIIKYNKMNVQLESRVKRY